MITKKNKDEFLDYLKDASNFKGQCEEVFFPENKDEVKGFLKDCYDNNIPVTISGNRTGLTGGAVPLNGRLISTDKLNKIIEFDIPNKNITVECGVLVSEIIKKTSSEGLLYPPDPTEKNCFIGGTIATNASGEKSFKYGATRNFILELNVLLMNGDEINIKRGVNYAVNNKIVLTSLSGQTYNLNVPDISMPNVKNASGYFLKDGMDAIDLFIGSEGTLGLVYSAKLKLIDKPVNIISSFVFFNKLFDGFRFIDNARRRSRNSNYIKALALEYMDEKSLDILRKLGHTIPQSSSAVWFEQELTNDETLNEDMISEWLSLINEFNIPENNIWFAIDEKDQNIFKQMRHGISEYVNEYIAKNNFRKLGTDTAVDENFYFEYIEQCLKLVNENNIDYCLYGHLGNSHLHLNMLPKNDEEFNLAKLIYFKMCRLAVDFKGTVSAEHGIGKMKKEYLLMMYGADNIRKMFEVKKVLDDKLLLGIGNVFDIQVVQEQSAALPER